MKKFVIRRDIHAVGKFDQVKLREAAGVSNAALARLAPDVQWVHSYVTDDATFCIYLARDEAAVRRHAELSGFPASQIAEVRSMFDPSTAEAPSVAFEGGGR
jgi:hypothetical protein